MSKLDKFFEAVAPGIAVRREMARRDLQTLAMFGGVGSSFASGNTASRLRSHAAFGRSNLTNEEDGAGNYGFDAMRLEAMDLYRNNPIARGIVETARRYTRPSRPRANSAGHIEAMGGSDKDIQAAKQWDAAATDWFNGYFWPRADSMRRPGMTFGVMQDIYIMLQFTQGDLAYIRTPHGWHMVEGIQIRTPHKLAGEKNIKHGFRFNAKGQMTHIYVCPFGRGGYIDENQFQRIPISSVVFCPWFFRAAQFRGVPRLHGVIDNLRDQEETHDATKQKVKNESMLLSIEKSGSRKKAPGASLALDDGSHVTTEPATYGMRFQTSGEPGKDFMFAKGDSPNAQYVQFMEYDSKIISSGAGVPYKILMSMYDGSWSANKAAQTALKVFINELWTNRRDVFCQRVWNAEIAEAIRTGELPPAPVDRRGISTFNRADWTRPYFPQLDQDKEEKGRSAAFRNFTASLDDWADEQGTTAEAMRQNHKRDMAALKKDADELGIPFEVYAGNLLASSTSLSGASATDEAETIDKETGESKREFLG